MYWRCHYPGLRCVQELTEIEPSALVIQIYGERHHHRSSALSFEKKFDCLEVRFWFLRLKSMLEPNSNTAVSPPTASQSASVILNVSLVRPFLSFHFFFCGILTR